MTWRMVSRRSIRNLQFGLLIASTLWGFDYLLPPTENGVFLNFVEAHSLFPLWGWGAIMVIIGTVGIISEYRISRDVEHLRNWWVGVWLAHIVFACIFAVLSFGSFISIVVANVGGAGFRTPVLWLFIAILHWSYAQRVDKNLIALETEPEDLVVE